MVQRKTFLSRLKRNVNCTLVVGLCIYKKIYISYSIIYIGADSNIVCMVVITSLDDK